MAERGGFAPGPRAFRLVRGGARSESGLQSAGSLAALGSLRGASPGGRAVLPYVGGDETPPDLYSDRWHVAAPLYVLSHSFVKFLIDNAGLEEVKQLLPAPDIGEALRSASGRGISEWKAAWLASLKGGTKTAGRESPAP